MPDPGVTYFTMAYIGKTRKIFLFILKVVLKVLSSSKLFFGLPAAFPDIMNRHSQVSDPVLWVPLALLL